MFFAEYSLLAMFDTYPASKNSLYLFVTMAKTRWAGVPAARKSARLASRSTARSTATAGPEALLPNSRCSPPPPPCESPMPSSPGSSSPSSPVAVPLPSLLSVSLPPSPAHCQSSPLNSVPRPAFLLPIPKPILPSPVQAVSSVLPLLISFFLILVLLLYSHK